MCVHLVALNFIDKAMSDLKLQLDETCGSILSVSLHLSLSMFLFHTMQSHRADGPHWPFLPCLQTHRHHTELSSHISEIQLPHGAVSGAERCRIYLFFLINDHFKMPPQIIYVAYHHMNAAVTALFMFCSLHL